MHCGIFARVYMTMRYAHTGDRETEATAERIGEVISGMLGVSEVK